MSNLCYHIWEANHLLFTNDANIAIHLNWIDSSGGECVLDEEEKKYYCLCKAKYSVTISREFYNTFLFILDEGLTRDKRVKRNEITVRREEFSALFIILKFYP